MKSNAVSKGLRLLIAIGAGLLAGCPSSTMGGDDLACNPNDFPTCGPSPPSWAMTVAPIIQTHCANCHGPGGSDEKLPLDDYSSVYTRRNSVLADVYACEMPPATEAPLTDLEHNALLTWLVCGAPNN